MFTRIVGLCACLGLLATPRFYAAENSEVGRTIQSYLDSLGAESGVSGAVMVAKDGQPIASKVAGLANRETKTPNTLETKFNLGSMNKMFTAVAIAQLAQKGRLKFDDTIAKVWPDYPNKEVGEKVTIHQLLTHTSGMGSYTNEKFRRNARS